jgi:hypothetical protein
MWALLLLFAKELVIPEVMEIIRVKQAAAAAAAGQPAPPMPTSEEVKAAFAQHVQEGIAKGTEYLATHPPTA